MFQELEIVLKSMIENIIDTMYLTVFYTPEQGFSIRRVTNMFSLMYATYSCITVKQLGDKKQQLTQI